jgi:1-acyl-sn-glycerol-3-phosphate acyltransferase
MPSPAPPPKSRIGSLLGAPFRFVYATYAIVLFLFLGLLALGTLLLVPGLQRRRTVGRAISGAFLRLAGMPVRVVSADRIPATQCVIVSNHASYLDGPVFTAVLPPRFGFVIKREMNGVPLAGLLLRKLGSEFVERFNRNRGAADTRRVLRNATSGNSLVFFPEGTFTPEPGLLKFHTGAFVAAARAGCPVVPAVVRGTRVALSPKHGVPRATRLEVEFLQPILPTGTSAEAVARLRDRAREAILRRLGEPDLTCSDDTGRRPDTALG